MRIYSPPLRRFAFLLFAGALLALTACEKQSAAVQTKRAFVIPEARNVGRLDLAHVTRGAFQLGDIEGDWSLFFFGYTHCPDVCPTELFMMAEMMRTLEKDPGRLQQAPQVVFVSVDPNRDDPRHLQDYAGYYHPSFLGVTGEQASIDRLTRTLGVFHERVYYRDGKIVPVDQSAAIPADLENQYLVNHSSAIFVFDPNSRLHAIFTPPHDADDIIHDLAALQDDWN